MSSVVPEVLKGSGHQTSASWGQYACAPHKLFTSGCPEVKTAGGRSIGTHKHVCYWIQIGRALQDATVTPQKVSSNSWARGSPDRVSKMSVVFCSAWKLQEILAETCFGML